MGKSSWFLPAGGGGRALIIAFSVIYSTKVFGFDFITICPPKFIDGLRYSVVCQVDMTTITAPSPPGKCLGVSGVLFELLLTGSSPSTQGSSDYPTCNTAFTGTARCVNTTSNLATYELRFTVDKATHHGRSLRCSSDCTQKVPGSVTEDYSTCANIQITDPCVPTPCESGGTCIPDVNDPEGFTCRCPKGFGNKTCNTPDIPSPPISRPGFCEDHNCLLFLLLLLLLLFLPIPLPLPWPGYPIYVLICRCIRKRKRSTGHWHPHNMCGMKTNDVFFSSCCVKNDGRHVLIWSKFKGRCVCYDTETTPSNNSAGAGHEMDGPPSHSNNVSPENVAVNNGNRHTS